MTLRLSTFAIVLVVLANALVLAGVAWNRSGDPGAVLALTERELAMPYDHWSSRESTGVSLSIRLAVQDHDWLDREKLDQLGFDVDRYDEGRRRDWRWQERRLFVVLEYDGAAFAAMLDERKAGVDRLRSELVAGAANRLEVEAAEAALARMRTAGSRLVAVDAGTDAAALRQRYPDPKRHVVTRALIGMQASRSATEQGEQGESINLRGRVYRILPNRVYLPRHFHEPLRRATDELRNAYDAPPRYRATVRWGRRQEPWISAIEPAGSPAQDSGR